MFAYDCSMKKKTISIILWVLVLCWMGVIFFMSAQSGTASHKMSSDVLEKIHEISQDEAKRTDEVHTKNFIDYYQYNIRQTAHFSMFAVLGILVTAASLYSVNKIKIRIILPLSLTVLCSFADELFQIYIPGRAFQWDDLGTDIVGSVLGCALVYLTYTVVNRLKRK